MSRYTPYFYQKDQTRAVSLTNKRHGSHATEVPTLSQYVKTIRGSLIFSEFSITILENPFYLRTFSATEYYHIYTIAF